MTGRSWLLLLLGVICGIIGSMIWDFFSGFVRYMKMKKAKEELMEYMHSGKPFELKQDDDGNMIFSFKDEEQPGDDDDAEDDTDRSADSKAETKRDCGAEKEDSRNTIG